MNRLEFNKEYRKIRTLAGGNHWENIPVELMDLPAYKAWNARQFHYYCRCDLQNRLQRFKEGTRTDLLFCDF